MGSFHRRRVNAFTRHIAQTRIQNTQHDPARDEQRAERGRRHDHRRERQAEQQRDDQPRARRGRAPTARHGSGRTSWCARPAGSARPKRARRDRRARRNVRVETGATTILLTPDDIGATGGFVAGSSCQLQTCLGPSCNVARWTTGSRGLELTAAELASPAVYSFHGLAGRRGPARRSQTSVSTAGCCTTSRGRIRSRRGCPASRPERR